MKFTATQISQILKGKVEGDANIEVTSFGKIEMAQAGEMSFLSNPRYEEFLYTTKASIVIINDNIVLSKPVSATLIRVQDAYIAFTILLEMYDKLQKQQLYKGIDKRAVIASKTKLGKNVYIGPNTVLEEGVEVGDNTIVLGNCYIAYKSKIGADSLIYSGVNIYKETIIGSRVIIHSGTVIGSDGFGFAPLPDGTYRKIPQVGNVIIGDDVEIGSNTCIDRATMGSTIIASGVKLDNLIQIAHNVEIDTNTVVAGHTAIAGSSKIGKNAVIAGKVGISGHLKLGDRITVGPQSGVLHNIKDGEKSMGYPSFNSTGFLKNSLYFKELGELIRKVRALEINVSKINTNS